MQQPNREPALGAVSYARAWAAAQGRPDLVAAAAVGDAGWGYLPQVSLAAAGGALALALANSAAVTGAGWAAAAFWLGLLMIVAPAAARLFSAGVTRREAAGLVALVGMALYLAKVMHSPTGFTFSDELQHWRTAYDIVQSGALFQDNPLLPVSPLFPGLESAATALSELGGLSLYTSGVIVVGAARLVGSLALFLLYERAAGAPRVAGIATLLYMANPSFLFFGAQFAYESLAVPLSALVLFAAARRTGERGALRVGLTVVALLALGAAIVTHHLTSYALASFLALWALVAAVSSLLERTAGPVPPATVRERMARIGAASRSAPVSLALLAIAASLTWMVYVATVTIGYLSSPLGGALLSTIQLMLGEGSSRELFRAGDGSAAPLWEQVLAYLHVMLVLVGLPLGALRVWQVLRGRPLALALTLAAAAYPASLAMRLTERGAEVSNRASAFLFVAVAFVLASWFHGRSGRGRAAPLFPAAFAAWASALLIGGVIIGWPGWARLPGPYLPAADTRSVERQGVAAAEWARDVLGPGNRVVADRSNRLLMGAYGEQRPVSNYRDQVKVANLYFTTELGPEDIRLLRRGGVRFIVMDRRLTEALPSAAVYIERGEPGAGRHQTPIDPAVIEKFEQAAGVSRVFDSGDIVIYDVGRLSGEQ